MGEESTFIQKTVERSDEKDGAKLQKDGGRDFDVVAQKHAITAENDTESAGVRLIRLRLVRLGFIRMIRMGIVIVVLRMTTVGCCGWRFFARAGLSIAMIGLVAEDLAA